MSFYSAQTAVIFDQVREEANWEGWRNMLLRRPNNLLPFAAAKELLNLCCAQDKGVQMIATSDIVGSVGRHHEFSRTFKPKSQFTEQRWRRVAEFYYRRGFDPIKVFKVSHIYFVVDGNHRVSVSRALNIKAICAHVYEFETQILLNHRDNQSSIRAKYHNMQKRVEGKRLSSKVSHELRNYSLVWAKGNRYTQGSDTKIVG